MCRVYSQRPSAVLQIEDVELAIDFDMAMAAVHRAERVTRITSTAKQNDVHVGLLQAAIDSND